MIRSEHLDCFADVCRYANSVGVDESAVGKTLWGYTFMCVGTFSICFNISKSFCVSSLPKHCLFHSQPPPTAHLKLCCNCNFFLSVNNWGCLYFLQMRRTYWWVAPSDVWWAPALRERLSQGVVHELLENGAWLGQVVLCGVSSNAGTGLEHHGK